MSIVTELFHISILFKQCLKEYHSLDLSNDLKFIYTIKFKSIKCKTL